MKWLQERLTEPSTWKAIFQLFGIAIGGSIYVVDNNFGHAVTGAIAGIGGGQAIASGIEFVTKDYKNTVTKLDDIVHAASTGFLKKK